MNDTTDTAAEVKTAYTIPRVFFDDHIARELPPFSDELRGLPEGVITKSTKSTYTVLLSRDEAEELFSDADYYSYIVKMSEDRWMFGLQSSARATCKRMRAQGF